MSNAATAVPETRLRGRAKNSQTREIISRFMKNKVAVAGFFIILLLVFCALFPSLIAPYSYETMSTGPSFANPSAEHLFGTDEFGRDIFSRVIYGTRTSLAIGLLSVLIACVLGTILGCISGYYGNLTDNLIMRAVDILLAIPNLMLAISIVAALGRSQTNLILALGIGATGGFARVVRGQILTVKEQEYIEVARAIGASDFRIIFCHILPNCLAPIIVQISISVGSSILGAAGMSFIGLGIAPPNPEWGAMLSAGRSFFRDHWFVETFPGLAIMLAVFAFNLFGDGLRDALDPRLKT
ncbi:Glutathione transport system permease protein gsiD [uncultured Flavonifractor sp.]|jgi:peptide/nickel transport system permease protein|uniref:ABC transporter permease n=1 Tax=Eubacteriales TaxID=186802 RepID=UPI0008210A7D|nr:MULTISPECIES: ABC transporter permease [Oscillospiraceae]MBS5590232.1 ABC transporter permease [Clostridiales bacterium]SCH67882.1 Glutathione transport system permease protein gsiD [uncultured Clostridium sp.]SCI56449.1 Glutathione transport system permease protein gsiD [uncultured Flavonifractor sp.]MCH1979283.1 ABC transporter permease [Lawsonibacter sp. OA9]MCU6703885.1 ABC transporter permease [Muriventricola aceti]